MRDIAWLFLLPAAAFAQLTLTPQDESDIRAAIEAQARTDNQRGSGEVWSERGPLVYRVERMERLAENVATADADGRRTPGQYPMEHRSYIFILTRVEGKWKVARRLQVCSGPGRVMIQPLALQGDPGAEKSLGAADTSVRATINGLGGGRRFGERGSSGCPG